MKYFDYDTPDASTDQSDQLAVFENISSQDWHGVIQKTQTLEFSPGDMLLQAGETDDAVYIMISGQVEVIGQNSFGFTRRIAVIDEGSVFGELAFFDNQPRSASIRAVTQGQVLRLSRRGFEEIAAWNPSLAQQFLFDLGRILAFRFRNEMPYKI